MTTVGPTSGDPSASGTPPGETVGDADTTSGSSSWGGDWTSTGWGTSTGSWDDPSTGTTGGGGESSSSTGELPSPSEVEADWVLQLDGFVGYAIETTVDGTIAVAGEVDGEAVVQFVTPEGMPSWSYTVDPASWAATPTASERAVELARLGPAGLAVSVARGPDDDQETVDGVFTIDAQTQVVGWAALIEGTSEYTPFYDSLTEWIPDTTLELLTTSDGDIFVSGTGVETFVSSQFPSYTRDSYWVKRLNPADGSEMWVYNWTWTGWAGEGPFGRQLIVDSANQRILHKSMTYLEYFGTTCHWSEFDWEQGEQHVTDFSIDSENLYCHWASITSDGRVMSPMEEFYAPTNQLHLADEDGVTYHPFEVTDIPHAYVIYLDDEDTMYVMGELSSAWAGYGVNFGLARLSLEPMSTDVLTTWSWGSPGDIVRDVAFGSNGEVLTLRRTDTSTLIEQRSL